MLQVLQSGYNTLSSNCQHVLASLTVGINNSKEDRILLLVLRARLWCLEEPEDQNLALCGQEAFCNWHNLSFLCGSDRSCNVGGDNPLQKEILDITGAIVSGNTASMVSL